MHAPQACLFGFHGVLFMGFCSTVGTHGGGAPQKRHGGCACCLASLRTSCFPRSSPAVALILALRAAQLHVRNVLLAREGDPHRRHLDAAKGEHGAMVCPTSGPPRLPFLPPAWHSFPNEEPRFLRFLFASVFMFFSPPAHSVAQQTT